MKPAPRRRKIDPMSAIVAGVTGLLLARQEQGETLSQLAWPVIVLAAIILLGGAGLLVLRRWPMSKGPPAEASKGFSVEEVEAMHQRGLLSDEEYRRAKRVALGLGPEWVHAPPEPLIAEAPGGDGEGPEAT